MLCFERFDLLRNLDIKLLILSGCHKIDFAFRYFPNTDGISCLLYTSPGAVVWMLISSVANAALSYAENSLGQVYKVEKDGVYTGGAYYYICLLYTSSALTSMAIMLGTAQRTSSWFTGAMPRGFA